jgi:hypothetical protein
MEDIHASSTSVNCAVRGAIGNDLGTPACKVVATQVRGTKLIIAAYSTLEKAHWVVSITGIMLCQTIRTNSYEQKKKVYIYAEFISLCLFVENRHVQRPLLARPQRPYAVIFILISRVGMHKHRQVAYTFRLKDL